MSGHRMKLAHFLINIMKIQTVFQSLEGKKTPPPPFFVHNYKYTYPSSISLFYWAKLARRKGPQPTHPDQKGQTTTPRTWCPTLCEQCMGSLTSHRVIRNKDCETRPTVYRPYPRRLESLTISRWLNKCSTFSSVNLKTLSVGPAEFWTRDLPHGCPVLYQLS